MDDSEKTLKYLISVEKLAEEILSDRRNIVVLDKRRNENREAMRALQGRQNDQGGNKSWLTVGAHIFKCPTQKALELIQKDQCQIDSDINKLRNELKDKMNKLRDLEQEPPLPGLMLAPLTKEESKALRSSLKYV